MIDHLVEKYGVDPNREVGGGWTALHMAADRGRVRTVKHLVEKHNVDIQQRNGYGETVLDLAKRRRHADVLDLLASEFGARIGVDCLTEAAAWGHDAMIDHLVEKYGVDPNGEVGGGWTALHCAAQCGRARTVKHLVEKYNVDIHKRTRDGETALDLAERHGMTECADVLRALQSTRPPPS